MKRRTWDENRARQLYEEGKSDVDIADMVGATAGAIAAWRSRNRLTSQNLPGAQILRTGAHRRAHSGTCERVSGSDRSSPA